MNDPRLPLNQTQRVRFESALEKLQKLSPAPAAAAAVTVADVISVSGEDGILKGHGTMEADEQVVATLCGVVEKINKLVYVRVLRSRYKPETGDIIIGRVIEVVQKRWKLEINFSQDAVLMLSSMNLPDDIQRRRNADDELNMRSILEESDVICAEVRGFQHDGSLHLQARSQKYGKLKRGQLLTVPAYLVKRRKMHFHHLEQYGVDLILGCNGFVWVGEHVEIRENAMDVDPENSGTIVDEGEQVSTPLEVRQHICRIANAVRVLSSLGFSLSIEVILDTFESSVAANINIRDMLGAELYVLTAEREVERRTALLEKRGRA